MWTRQPRLLPPICQSVVIRKWTYTQVGTSMHAAVPHIQHVDPHYCWALCAAVLVGACSSRRRLLAARPQRSGLRSKHTVQHLQERVVVFIHVICSSIGLTSWLEWKRLGADRTVASVAAVVACGGGGMLRDPAQGCVWC